MGVFDPPQPLQTHAGCTKARHRKDFPDIGWLREAT